MNKTKLVTSLKNRKVITLTITAFIIALFCFFTCSTKKKVQSQRELSVVMLRPVVVKQDTKSLTAMGVIKAAQGIDITAPTSNIVQSIDFLSGQYVDAGTVLVTLKNDELKATVKEDKIKYDLAKSNANRSKKLVGKGYISRQDSDLTDSNVKQAKARLDHDRALLANTIIKAPFSGTLGISQVNLGQYLSAGQVIVALQDQSNMHVDFSISEKNSDLIAVDRKIIVRSNQASQHEWQGKTTALGSQLDENTRSLPVRAELFPPYKNLKPGMFVHVTVLLPEAENKPAISQNAIVYNPYGNFVYLYKKGVVLQRYVDIGQKIGGEIIIEKGLKAGEEVVIEGQQKLYNGAKVQIRG